MFTSEKDVLFSSRDEVHRSHLIAVLRYLGVIVNDELTSEIHYNCLEASKPLAQWPYVGVTREGDNYRLYITNTANTPRGLATCYNYPEDGLPGTLIERILNPPPQIGLDENGNLRINDQTITAKTLEQLYLESQRLRVDRLGKK